MASEAAKAVAEEVIATVRKGKKPNKYQIQQKHGYSESSARAQKAIKTKTYQNEIGDFVAELKAERIELLKHARTKREKATYRDSMDGLDKLTKQIQLLSGGATEDITFRWDE